MKVRARPPVPPSPRACTHTRVLHVFRLLVGPLAARAADLGHDHHRQLARVVHLPPEQRGARLVVVQRPARHGADGPVPVPDRPGAGGRRPRRARRGHMTRAHSEARGRRVVSWSRSRSCSRSWQLRPRFWMRRPCSSSHTRMHMSLCARCLCRSSYTWMQTRICLSPFPSPSRARVRRFRTWAQTVALGAAASCGCMHARNDSDQVPTSSASARGASGPTSLPLPHLRSPVRLPPVSARFLARPACHPRPSQSIPAPGPRSCTSSIRRPLVLALLRKYALSPSYRTYPHAIPLPQCSPCLGPGPSLPPVPRASVPAPAPRTTRYRIVPAAAYDVRLRLRLRLRPRTHARKSLRNPVTP